MSADPGSALVDPYAVVCRRCDQPFGSAFREIPTTDPETGESRIEHEHVTCDPAAMPVESESRGPHFFFPHDAPPAQATNTRPNPDPEASRQNPPAGA